ncbi:MAG: hypothetical protein GC168_07805 [Candidatus Hydrogenedens sp.]|nr:hypothetical protein [Candidatus Hydrogenedens sp.]
MSLSDRLYTWWIARHCRKVGPGTRFVGANIEIKGRVEIGARCEIGGNVGMRTHKGGSIRIGDEVFISDYVLLQVNDTVEIGNGAYLGPYVVLRDTNHTFTGTDQHWRYTPVDTRPIRIGANAYIGSSTYVLPGVTVGEGAVIAPGSIVNRDVGPLEVWAGAPAIRVAHRTDPSVTTTLSRYRELAGLFGFGAASPAAPAEPEPAP